MLWEGIMMNLDTLALTRAIAGSAFFVSCFHCHPPSLCHFHNLTLFVSESDLHRNQSPHRAIIIIDTITVIDAKVIVVMVVMAPSIPPYATPPSLCPVHRVVRGLVLDSKCFVLVLSKLFTLSSLHRFNINAFTHTRTAYCR